MNLCVRTHMEDGRYIIEKEKCNRCTRDLLSIIIDRLLMSFNYFLFSVRVAFFFFFFFSSICLAKLCVWQRRSNVHNRTTAVCMFALMYRHWVVCIFSLSLCVIVYTIYIEIKRFICQELISRRTEIKGRY